MPTLPTFTKQTAPPKRRRRRRAACLPWYARLISLVVLLFVYATGYNTGRESCLNGSFRADHNHPAYHPNLKP